MILWIWLWAWSLYPAQPAEIINPYETLKTALELYEKKEFAASLNYYQNYLKSYSKGPYNQAVQMMAAECMRELAYGKESRVDQGDAMLFRDPKVAKQYERVIKMNSSNALAESAQFRLIEMLYNSGAYNEAARAWDQFLDHHSDSYLKAEALFALAQTQAMLSLWEDLDQTLVELLRINPAYEENDEVLYLIGIVAFGKRNLSKALEAFEKIKSQDAPSLYYTGKTLLGLSKPIYAAKKFQELIKKFPKDELVEEASYLFAESFFAAQDYLGAIEEYQNYLEAYPKSPYTAGAAYKIGLAQFARRRYLEARNAFEKALAADSRSDFSAWGQYLIAESYFKEGHLKEASFAYADMAGKFPSNPFAANALYKLAWCSFLDKNYLVSEAQLRKMLLLYPNHSIAPSAYLLLGNSLAHLEKYGDAVVAYQKAVDLSFPSETAEAALSLLNRAMVLSQNYPAIVSGYHFLLNNYPTSASPWRAFTYLYVAEGYFRSGLYNEAMNIYRSVLKLYTASAAAGYAQDGLAWAQYKLGRYKETELERDKIRNYEHDFEPAAEQLKTNDYEMGNSLFNQKKYTDALAKYEKFVKENTTHELASEANFRIGLCYAQLNYYGQAIEAWESLKKNYPGSPAALKANWKIADTYFRAAKYDAAIQTYQEIRKLYPKDLQISLAHLRIAQGYYNSQQGDLALQEFKSLILNYPDSPDSKESLDFLVTLLDQPQVKQKALETLLEIAQKLGATHSVGAEAQFRTAQYYFESKDYANTAKELEKLVGKFLLVNLMAEKEYYLGESYYQLGSYHDAVSTFERLIKNFPEDPKVAFALFRLGGTYFKLENYPESAAAFNRAAKDFPRSEYAANAIYNAAVSFKKAKQWEDAKTALSYYMQNYPEKAKESNAQDELLDLYQQTKDFSSAITLLESLRKDLSPTSDRYGELTTRIAENYVLQGSYSSAVLEYERLLSSLPPQNSWRLNASIKLVELYEKNEQWKEAVRIYEQIVANAPKEEWIKAAKARLEFIRSNYPAAFLK